MVYRSVYEAWLTRSVLLAAYPHLFHPLVLAYHTTQLSTTMDDPRAFLAELDQMQRAAGVTAQELANVRVKISSVIEEIESLRQQSETFLDEKRHTEASKTLRQSGLRQKAQKIQETLRAVRHLEEQSSILDARLAEMHTASATRQASIAKDEKDSEVQWFTRWLRFDANKRRYDQLQRTLSTAPPIVHLVRQERAMRPSILYEDDTAPQHTSPPAVDVHHPPRHLHQLPSAILTELEEACASTRVQVKEVENRIQQIQV